MNRASKFLLIFGVIASAAPLDLSAWKYRKRIPLTPGGGVAVVKLDREVYTGARQSFTDLRIIRDGEEVAWTMHYPMGDHVESADQTLLDKGVVEGKGVRFTLKASGPHDRVSIFSQKENFRQKVIIEASPDGKEWAVLRSDGSIFDFSQDGRRLFSTDVPYPVSTRRFLRVTILGWMDPSVDLEARLSLGSAAVEYPMETLSTITPVVVEDSAAQSTVLTLDQGVTGLPIHRLLLSSSSPTFHRGVSIEVSEDGTNWRRVREGFIRRVRDGNFSEESMYLPVDEQTGDGSRYERIRIYNGDDKPLQFGPVQSQGRIRLVKFRASDKGEYWLYYGNPAAVKQPQYDISETLSSTEKLLQTAMLAGRAEANPTYHPPPAPRKPWSEEHPAILYTVLGGAVLALGIATLRFMARLRTPA